jgi:glutamate-1-semialdehyde 2,1-aminomutase
VALIKGCEKGAAVSVQSEVAAAEWIHRAMEALPGGTSITFRPNPDLGIVVESGRGAIVTAVDGRSWVDYVLGSGPMILGHANPAVVAAVTEQVAAGSTFYAINMPAVELAEEVNRAVPCAEQTKFATSGSEATFYALRLARAATGRDLIIKLEGAYHGNHDYAAISMTPPPAAPMAARPDFAGVPKAVADLVVVAPFNSADALEHALETHRGKVAAVLMEPYQRGIPPEPGYLPAVRDLTRSHGVVLIFDEVVTGFRLAYGGAQEYYGVVPDLCTLGKILGGGFPLSAVTGRREIMDLASIDHGPGGIFWNGTLNGNPVSAAAGLATLGELRKPGVYEGLFAAGARLRAGLAQALREHGIAAHVLGEGPMFYVEFTDRSVRDYRDTAAGDKRMLKRIGDEMMRRGFLWHAVQRNYISTCHTEDLIDDTVQAYGDALTTLQGT